MTSGQITSEYITQRYAKYAMYGSLFPFFLTAVIMLLLGKDNYAFTPLFEIFKVWSALIIAFLGGIRFGLSISPRTLEQKSIVYATLSVLLAWFSILLPGAYSVLVLLVIHCAMGAWDNFYANNGYVKPWYGKLRMIMTFWIALFHIVVFILYAG